MDASSPPPPLGHLHRAALALLVGALVLAPAATAQMTIRFTPIAGLQMTPVEAYVVVAPGGFVTTEVLVNNTGNETLDLTLAAIERPSGPANGSTPPPTTLTLRPDPAEIRLAPNASTRVNVTITAAADAPPGAQKYGDLQARHADGRSGMAFAPLRVKIAGGGDDAWNESAPGGSGSPSGGRFTITQGSAPGGVTMENGTLSEIPAGSSRTTSSSSLPPVAVGGEREVPIPALAAVFAAVAAAFARRTRPHAPRRGIARTLLGTLLVAVLLTPALATPILAQAAEVKTFAVEEMTRDGETLTIRLTNVGTSARLVTAGLYVNGALAATPEQTRETWFSGDSHGFTFTLLRNVTQATLKIHYRLYDDNVPRETTYVLTLPDPEDPELRRLIVEDALLTEDGTATFTLRNGGTRATGPIRIVLEDATGIRIGAPYEQEVSNLAANRTTRVAFALAKDAEEATLVLEYGGRTERNVVNFREEEAIHRVSVMDATLSDDLTATLHLANFGNRTESPVTVSVQDAQGVKRGIPLVQRVDALAPGDTREVAFRLDEDLTDLTVVLEYAARTETTRIRLREIDGTGTGGAAPGRLSLETDLPSLEASPGGAMDFALRLENEGGKDRLAQLKVEGLPSGYTGRFTVQGSGVPSLQVPAGSTRNLVLSVSVPEAATRDVGTTIPFAAVVEVDGVEAARLPLTLSISGKGRLEIEGDNWFASLAPGESAEMQVRVKNAGSAPLYDVDLSASRLTGWDATFSPARIDRIDPGESETVTVRVTAPQDVGTGKYVLDLTAANSLVSARARSLSLDVAAPQSSNAGWIIAAALAAVVAVAIIVKVKRR